LSLAAGPASGQAGGDHAGAGSGSGSGAGRRGCGGRADDVAAGAGRAEEAGDGARSGRRGGAGPGRRAGRAWGGLMTVFCLVELDGGAVDGGAVGAADVSLRAIPLARGLAASGDLAAVVFGDPPVADLTAYGVT